MKDFRFDAWQFPETKAAIDVITHVHDVELPGHQKLADYHAEKETARFWSEVEAYVISRGLVKPLNPKDHDMDFRIEKDTGVLYMKYRHQKGVQGVEICKLEDHPTLKVLEKEMLELEKKYRKELDEKEKSMKSRVSEAWGVIKDKMIELKIIDSHDEKISLGNNRFIFPKDTKDLRPDIDVAGIENAIESALSELGIQANVIGHAKKVSSQDTTSDVSGIRGAISKILGKK